MSLEASIGTLLAGAGISGGAWALFHPRATVFGPVVWCGAPERPTAALTFDDGPHPEYTERIAEILERHRVRATFFCIGRHLERQTRLGSALHRAGHELENHTFTHGVGRDLFQLPRLRADLARCQAVVASVTGSNPAYYRPAVGIRNPVVHRAARATGLTVVTWTHAARDGLLPLGTGRARRLARRASPGSILALHDGCFQERSGVREKTVRNLPELLRGLRDKGLTLVTLRELLNPA